VNYYFHPAAEAEHLETVGYYESKRPGLGASYLVEFVRAILFIAIVAISVLADKLHPIIFAIYAGLRIPAYLVYVADKSVAKKGTLRTQ